MSIDGTFLSPPTDGSDMTAESTAGGVASDHAHSFGFGFFFVR